MPGTRAQEHEQKQAKRAEHVVISHACIMRLHVTLATPAAQITMRAALQQETLMRFEGAQWMEHADSATRAAAGAPGFAAAGVAGARRAGGSGADAARHAPPVSPLGTFVKWADVAASGPACAP